MFKSCKQLKKIDVSKFNSSKCLSIDGMFCGCNKLNEINMINWNMNSIEVGREKFDIGQQIKPIFSYLKNPQ